MTLNDTQKPAWAGDRWLAQLVNQCIRIKPLYAVMKRQARQVLIKTAEQKGIPWQEFYDQFTTAELSALLPDITNPGVTYPDYYRVPFHAYEAGNLCWQAALEAEAATYAIALRVWPHEQLSWQAAQDRLRQQFYTVLDRYITGDVYDILDVGCSVGISTLRLHRHFQQHQPAVRTVGLDLSPYMLAVATARDTDQAIIWRHAQAEHTGLPSTSFDLVSLQFVAHELPDTAARSIFQEAWRLLRPGGTLAIMDNDPQSPVIQNLPPVLFTLMKSTEPWTDSYYSFDIATALADLGFCNLWLQAVDPRHRAILAQKEYPLHDPRKLPNHSIHARQA